MRVVIGLSRVAVLASLLFSFSALAQDAAVQFKDFLSQVQSAEGEFVQQQVRPPRLGDDKPKVIRKSQGNFIFQRPGKFVWSTHAPYEQKVIADGQNLLLWDKDLNQLSIRPLTAGLSSTPAAILFGHANIDEQFDVVSIQDKGGMNWLELRAKSGVRPDAMPYAKIGVGMQAGLPAALELYDNFGTVTLITLSKIKTNQTLPIGAFKFNPPAGADVVRIK